GVPEPAPTSPSARDAAAARSPSAGVEARASTPPSPTLTATAPASSSASPNMVSVVSVSGVPVPAPIAVHLKLAANQRLRDRFVRILGVKERPIDALEQQRELTVLDVRGAAQIVLLEDAQHVPSQVRTHVRDDAGRHVGVGIDARPRDQPFGVRRQLGGECAHESLKSEVRNTKWEACL